jgi:Homing endonuclease associated repeat
MSATMAKGPTPNFSDSVLKHAIVGIVKTYPHISPESLSGELHETASVGRLAKLIKQSAKWNGRKWICTIRLGLTSDSNPLPSIVSVIKEDLKNGMKPMLIATKHGIEYSMVLGVNRGRYDGLLKTPRNSKKFVKVNNLLKLYDEKGYEPSGKSIKGALEVSDDCNQIRCHVCGDWFENLAAHVRYEHDMKTRDYKMTHSLNLGTALIGDAQRIRKIAASIKQGNQHLVAARARRAQMIQAGTGGIGNQPAGLTKGGLANLKGNCAVQLTTDLKVLADRIGHCPSVREVKLAGICYDAVRYRFGGVKEALATIGTKLPHKKSGRTRWYTSDRLIEMLRAFHATHKRQPFRSDLRRGLLPSNTTFVNHFGSLNNALVKAGMHANARGWKGVRIAKRAMNLATKTSGAPVAAYKVSRTKEEAL